MAEAFGPRQFLQQGAGIPRGIEAQLPAGLPSVSGILTQVAGMVPDIPIPTPAGAAQLPAQLIQRVEAVLPSGAPKVSSVLGVSAYRKMDGPAAKAGGVRILGGGYRSI